MTFAGQNHSQYSLHSRVVKIHFESFNLVNTLEWCQKVDDERFVGKTGKVSLKKSFFKTRAGNNSPKYASDPVFLCRLITYNTKSSILTV